LEKVSPLLWEFQKENGISKNKLGLMGEIFECNHVPNFFYFSIQLLGLNVVLGGNMPFTIFFLLSNLDICLIKLPHRKPMGFSKRNWNVFIF
jgi:hypothetical protein